MKIINLLSPRDQKVVAFVEILLDKSTITKYELCDRLNCTPRALDTLIKNVKQDSFFGEYNVSIQVAHKKVFFDHPSAFEFQIMVAHYLKRSTKFRILDFAFKDKVFSLPGCSQLFISKTEYYRQTKELNDILKLLQLEIRKGRLEGPDCQKVILFDELYSLINEIDEASISNAKTILQRFGEPLTDKKTLKLSTYIYVLDRIVKQQIASPSREHQEIHWQEPISKYLTILQSVLNIKDVKKRHKVYDMLFIFIISRVAGPSGKLIQDWDAFVKKDLPDLYEGIQWWEHQLLEHFDLTSQIENNFLKVNTFYYFNPGGVCPMTLKHLDVENDLLIKRVVEILKKRLSLTQLHLHQLSYPAKQILIYLYVRMLLTLFPKSQLTLTIGLDVKSAGKLSKYIHATVELFTDNKVQIKALNEPSDLQNVDLVISEQNDFHLIENSASFMAFHGSYSDLADLPTLLNRLALKKYVSILSREQ